MLSHTAQTLVREVCAGWWNGKLSVGGVADGTDFRAPWHLGTLVALEPSVSRVILVTAGFRRQNLFPKKIVSCPNPLLLRQKVFAVTSWE